jgi:DnaK suppressor protein
MARRDALIRLHQSLLARRAELRKRLGMELRDLSRSSESTTGDAADVAFDSTGEEVTSQLAELEAKELQQIEHALRKLKQGTYGLCEGCNSRIPVSRLNVLPYSILCIACQREMETDSSWWSRRAESGWDRLSDHEGGMDEKVVRLSDLEIDYTK